MRHWGRKPSAILQNERVLGLAEVMDIPAVLAGAPEILGKIYEAVSAEAPVDGHAAGLAARDLIAYVAAGIHSDHESTTVEERMLALLSGCSSRCVRARALRTSIR